jgi:hypothetical protein
MIMADAPTSGTAPDAAKPTPTAEPPPQPRATNAQPRATDAQPSAPAAKAPDLDPGQQVLLDLPDGTTRAATLQEMADAYTAQATQPKPDPEQMKKFELFQKAQDGDPQAARTLVEQAFPTPTSDPATPADERVQQLETQINEMQAQMSTIAPTVEQITTLRMTQALKGQIEQHKQYLPYAAQHPQGAERTLNIYNKMKQLAAQQNVDLANHPRHADVVVAAMKQADNEIRSEFEAYQAFQPAQQTPTNGVITAQDDQQKPQDPGPAPPGAVQLLHGTWVDQWGRTVAPVAGQPQMADIPTAGITPPASHTAPGVGANVQPKEGMSLKEFQDWMKTKVQEITTQ